MSQRLLTDAEQSMLQSLNNAVHEAIEARRVWLDFKMLECSKLQVGDPIYDIESGYQVGIVSNLYRYSLDWNYEYETLPNCFDNTSRQIERRFGTKEEALKRAEWKAKALRETTMKESKL